MRKLSAYIFIMTTLIFLSGCGSVRLRDSSPEQSLVFAYFDFSEIQMHLKWGNIKQALPLTDKPYHSIGYMPNPGEKGKYAYLVWSGGLQNGSYQVVSIGGDQTLLLRGAKTTLNFGEIGKNFTAVRIDKPGIYFLGAYKYHQEISTWASRFGAPTNFEMMPMESPSRKELLTDLLELSKGTTWEDRIRKELNQIPL